VPRPLTIALGFAALATWARHGGVRHVVVQGPSMAPTLRSGDRLVLVRLPGRVRAGQLALAADPRLPDRLLIKRAWDVGPHGVDLRGDNPAASTDSRTFGRVPVTAVSRCVAWRYLPAGRAGAVR
jgi:nickel-type superoxide dismutase maturation protease